MDFAFTFWSYLASFAAVVVTLDCVCNRVVVLRVRALAVTK
jgi:hypothetical protein